MTRITRIKLRRSFILVISLRLVMVGDGESMGADICHQKKENYLDFPFFF